MQTVILDTFYNLSLLAQLGSETSVQPVISQLVEALYESMFNVIVSEELSKNKVAIKTRIYAKDKRGVYKGLIIKSKQKAVVVNVLRAGLQPSNIFYMKLCQLLDPKYVRQDHIMAQRIETKHGVTGTNLLGSKIGGSVKDAVVFIPDPMGATGHSMTEVIDYYEKNHGPAKAYVPVHLIISPKYLSRIKKLSANVHVYSARKDKGLVDDDYIYPGLGGVGELINNTKK